LAVHEGRCECVLATDRPDDQFYLIVGALARKGGPHRVTVRTETTTDALRLQREEPSFDPAWRRRIDEVADRLERARGRRPAAAAFPPLESPPAVKVFHLFV